jgi:hypothetical protein
MKEREERERERAGECVTCVKPLEDLLYVFEGYR